MKQGKMRELIAEIQTACETGNHDEAKTKLREAFKIAEDSGNLHESNRIYQTAP